MHVVALQKRKPWTARRTQSIDNARHFLVQLNLCWKPRSGPFIHLHSHGVERNPISHSNATTQGFTITQNNKHSNSNSQSIYNYNGHFENPRLSSSPQRLPCGWKRAGPNHRRTTEGCSVWEYVVSLFMTLSSHFKVNITLTATPRPPTAVQHQSHPNRSRLHRNLPARSFDARADGRPVPESKLRSQHCSYQSACHGLDR